LGELVKTNRVNCSPQKNSFRGPKQAKFSYKRKREKKLLGSQKENYIQEQPRN
jgi:hypothetical protein